MNDRDAGDAKARILKAATALLNEANDPTRVTVRQIAERAKVGIGSINYHFQSKDALLNEAVGAMMMQEAMQWFEPVPDEDVDPVIRLKALLKNTAKIAVRYRKLTQMMLTYELQHGDFNVPLLIVPLLQAIFKEKKTEKELRVIALQIVLPMQVLFLRTDTFRMYAGLDMFNEQQLNLSIDLLIDNLTQNQGENQ